MIARGRKISADDYPEHLNPFADDDVESVDLRNNRFNTTGRRRARPSLKDAWESNPSAALDVAVPVRGPTPARPPPPRLSLSPPPPPPSEVQRQSPARPLTQPPPPAPAPAPDAAPGKPARRRFSFSRTLDAGSRLLLSPALLRRFRPGAAPASAPAKSAPPPTAAPDLRGSIRRSQSQAIPTTPPPVGDTCGLNSRAGSNWTLADGGFPQRFPSYRPKKRRAPPPPPTAATAPAPPAAAAEIPVSVTVTTPAETRDTTRAEQQAEVVRAGAETAVVRVEVGVTLEPATPPPSSPGEAAAGQQRTEVQDQQRQAGGGAPLAQGEDMPADDGEALAESVAVAVAEGGQEGQPSGAAGQPSTREAVEADQSVEPPVPADAGQSTEPPAPAEAAPAEVVEGRGAEPAEKSAQGGDSAQPAVAVEGVAAPPPEPSPTEEADPRQGLALTIRVYKEDTAPSPQEPQDSQGGDAEGATGESLQVVEPTAEVELKLEAASDPEPATATAADVPLTETDAKEPLADRDQAQAPGEPSRAALATFREDYLTRHYKGDLPVLQITESDLADEKGPGEEEEGSPEPKPAAALPVLHISEEDLRAEPAAGGQEGGEGSPETRAESPQPQPQPRQSPAQELNSRIYFRVLPPLAGGAVGGGPPQLKTFAPPSSPPGRGPKPQPPIRNGVAAAHAASGDASPPRTKSPLPTPRRRHQTSPRDA